jgi:Uma2 family endonuclease
MDAHPPQGDHPWRGVIIHGAPWPVHSQAVDTVVQAVGSAPRPTLLSVRSEKADRGNHRTLEGCLESLGHPGRQAEIPMINEQRIVIRDVTWHVYETRVEGIGEGQHLRVAYDGKEMEIMTTGFVHEQYKTLFGRIVNAVTVELDITCHGGGETTWKRPHVNRGIESDQSYYFDADKLAVVEESFARRSNDVADYPDPDLAVEIDISPSQVDRPDIYAAIKVPEVWRFDGQTVVIEQLDPDGAYRQVESSRFLPVRVDEVTSWITAEDAINRTACARRLRTWIREELAPRHQGQP